MNVRDVSRRGRRVTSAALRLAAASLLAVALACASVATADPTADGSATATTDATEVMVVTGAYTPHPDTTIPISVTTLDGAELDRSISLSLEDALRFVPGLQVARQGGRGGRTDLSLRGLDPNHVLVLVDGVRLNDPTNSRGGSFDPSPLALLDIERVEILRGPLSAVHGSDALAGAINIITRSGLDRAPEASVRARGGRFHEGNAIAQARGALGDDAGLSLGAAFDTFRDPNSDGGLDAASLKARLDGRLPGGIEAGLVTRVQESSARGFPDSSGGSELAVIRAMEDRQVREWLVGAEARRRFGGDRKIELRASHASRREDLDSPGVDVVPPLDPLGQGDIPVTRSGDEYGRWSLTALGTLDSPVTEILGTAHRTILTAGTNVLWEDGESDSFTLLDFGGGPAFVPQSFHDHRRTIGVFGELTHEIGDAITLSASLRQDFVRGEKDRLSPAVGASVAIPESPLVLFGHYGEGYKLPSFYALGKPVVGNPDLLTETSRGWEIGLRATRADGRLRAQVAYFDLRVKELIDFDAATFRLVNRDRLVSRGVEAELAWTACDALDLRFGGTWNDTDFEGSDLDPTGRPEWRGFAEAVARPVDALEITLRALLVSSVKATSFVTGDEVRTLSGYERIDLGLRWQVVDWIALIGELQNLTDATPREAIGFESPGISARAGVELRL